MSRVLCEFETRSSLGHALTWLSFCMQGLGDFDKSASISSSLPAWATVQMFADEMAARKVPVSGCTPQAHTASSSTSSSAAADASVRTQVRLCPWDCICQESGSRLF